MKRLHLRALALASVLAAPVLPAQASQIVESRTALVGTNLVAAWVGEFEGANLWMSLAVTSPGIDPRSPGMRLTGDALICIDYRCRYVQAAGSMRAETNGWTYEGRLGGMPVLLTLRDEHSTPWVLLRYGCSYSNSLGRQSVSGTILGAPETGSMVHKYDLLEVEIGGRPQTIAGSCVWLSHAMIGEASQTTQ